MESEPYEKAITMSDAGSFAAISTTAEVFSKRPEQKGNEGREKIFLGKKFLGRDTTWGH